MNFITEARDLGVLTISELTDELNKQHDSSKREGKQEKSVVLKISQNDVSEDKG